MHRATLGPRSTPIPRKPGIPRGLKRSADGAAKSRGDSGVSGFTATPLKSTPPKRLSAQPASTPSRVAPPQLGEDNDAALREKFSKMPRLKLPAVLEKKKTIIKDKERAKMLIQKEIVAMDFQHTEAMKPDLEQRDVKRLREAEEVLQAKAQHRASWVETMSSLLDEHEAQNRSHIARLETRDFHFLTSEITVTNLALKTNHCTQQQHLEFQRRQETLLLTEEHKVQERLASEKTQAASLRNDAIKQSTGVIVAEKRQLEAEMGEWQAREQSAALQMESDKLALVHHEDERRRLHNKLEELKGNIRVFCRIRQPLTVDRDIIEYEIEQRRTLRLRGKERAALAGPSSKAEDYSFRYDHVFSPQSTQEEVFAEIAPMVQSCLDGFKVCIFAYGQTGSGKTFTMEGPPTNKGVIPRAVNMIFRKVSTLKTERGFTCQLSCSFLEIYNDQIIDLLQKSGGGLRLGGSESEVVVDGLSEHVVTDEQTVVDLLSIAQSKRACASTKMNNQSSRSHSVFMLRIKLHNPVTGVSLSGLLNLIDLAGSEKVSDSEVQGQRLKEAIAINTSLTHLGDVIYSIGAGGHVPFRNCTLTRLLRPSLGGSSKCLMLVNTRYVFWVEREEGGGL